MVITTDICIIGAGAAGLFAVLEAGASNLHCCILKTDTRAENDVKEQALADYLKVAVSEFSPVYTDEFLEDLIKTDPDTYLVRTTNGREIACKYVIFTDRRDLID
ncbi:hypothetical protein [Dyadobacter sp. CY356]|uniref:hypothetical protein n=1 Tax=Dyadobacter sp. CY356 TaxID=2906442 RepID=UPI001F1CA908|nr:hypothetical protein [Dyadobacter sp. CY356]MCF0054843.1 hypothetical protein [Dyadobacter sp. CY356]